MLEIIILALLAVTLLAKHYGKGRGRRRYNLRRVRVSPELALTTLGTDTALIVDFATAADGTYRCMSINGAWAVSGMTAGEGPVTVGIAHGDYTVAEVKECLEQAGSISVGNKVAQEVANRLVRVVGYAGEAEPMLNEGRPIKTRLNWLIPIGSTISMFAFNEQTSALTTGSRLNFTGDMWVKDSS